MKKKQFERRKALREAYYNELRKQGVLDVPKEKEYQDMTKGELVEAASSLGIELDMKQTKAKMISMIKGVNGVVIKEGDGYDNKKDINS